MLCISYVVSLEPLRQPQVLAYPKRLAADRPIYFGSLEKLEDWVNVPDGERIAQSVASAYLQKTFACQYRKLFVMGDLAYRSDRCNLLLVTSRLPAVAPCSLGVRTPPSTHRSVLRLDAPCVLGTKPLLFAVPPSASRLAPVASDHGPHRSIFKGREGSNFPVDAVAVKFLLIPQQVENVLGWNVNGHIKRMFVWCAEAGFSYIWRIKKKSL